jgi:hypothetical protein
MLAARAARPGDPCAAGWPGAAWSGRSRSRAAGMDRSPGCGRGSAGSRRCPAAHAVGGPCRRAAEDAVLRVQPEAAHREWCPSWAVARPRPRRPHDPARPGGGEDAGEGVARAHGGDLDGHASRRARTVSGWASTAWRRASRPWRRPRRGRRRWRGHRGVLLAGGRMTSESRSSRTSAAGTATPRRPSRRPGRAATVGPCRRGSGGAQAVQPLCDALLRPGQTCSRASTAPTIGGASVRGSATSPPSRGQRSARWQRQPRKSGRNGG